MVYMSVLWLVQLFVILVMFDKSEMFCALMCIGEERLIGFLTPFL